MSVLILICYLLAANVFTGLAIAVSQSEGEEQTGATIIVCGVLGLLWPFAIFIILGMALARKLGVK